MRAHVRLDADVAAGEEGFAAGFAHFGDGALARSAVDLGDDDPRPVGGEEARRGAALGRSRLR